MPEATTQIELVIPDTLAQTTRDSLQTVLKPIFDAAGPLCIKARTIVVTDANDRAGMKLAADTRKAIKAIRVSGEKKRKELKEEALRTGQGIDRIFKPFDEALSGHEEYLLQQEQFAERAEAAALAALKVERDGQLVTLGVDPAMYNSGSMSAEAFAATLDGIRAQKKAAAEAAAKAEADRVVKEKADAEERARVAAENARLKQEAEAREKAMADERAAAEKLRRGAEAKARAEREAIEAQARKDRQAAEAVAKKEREAREKAEAELRAKTKAEADAKAAADKAAKKAAAAPDKTKIVAYAASLRAIKLPECKTEGGSELCGTIGSRVDSLADWINEQAGNL